MGLNIQYTLMSSALFAMGVGLSFLIKSPLWFYTTSLYCTFVSIGLAAMGAWMYTSTQITRPRLLERIKGDLNNDHLDLKGEDLFALPYSDKSVKQLFINFESSSIDNPKGRKQALAEIRRILDSGGEAIIVDGQLGRYTQRHLPGSTRSTLYSHCPPIEIIRYRAR